MPKYRTTEDIVIPAGTEVDVEPPHSRDFATQTVSILLETSDDTTAEWIMDLADAIEDGLIEEVEEEET